LPYTLGQAAKATGKQKSTILEAIRNGRLSASRDDKKQWQIEPAELHRVYPPNPQNVATERYETPPNSDKTELLEAKIRFLEREVIRLERTEADLKEDRDHWRRQATALLTDQRQSAPEEALSPVANEGRGRLWQKLFGNK
jgi:hypothetical protein